MCTERCVIRAHGLVILAFSSLSNGSIRPRKSCPLRRVYSGQSHPVASDPILSGSVWNSILLDAAVEGFVRRVHNRGIVVGTLF